MEDLTNEEGKNCIAFVCMENGKVAGAFTHQHVAHHISKRAVDLEGLIDLNEHTVADILQHPGVYDGCRTLSAKLSLFEPVKILKEPKTRVVVVVDPEAGTPVGVILRAHRRY